MIAVIWRVFCMIKKLQKYSHKLKLIKSSNCSRYFVNSSSFFELFVLIWSTSYSWSYWVTTVTELMINKLHGLSPSGGLVSPSGGFASLFFDQVEYFASIKLCQALSRQGAIIKIPVARCHYLLCSSAQLNS